MNDLATLEAVGAPRLSSLDLPRIKAAVREILEAIGEDPNRDGLRETPARVARMCEEVFTGLHQSPAQVLDTTFDIGHEELVMVREVSF